MSTHHIDGKFSVASIRILVVDDHAPFRQFVCSLLVKKPEFQVVGEVSDGLQALQKVGELLPDLVLLDIGLPGLNGIEVARQMREFAPAVKILFLSQESALDIVQEALSFGAAGYVAKAGAGSDLLSAVETVIRGEPFVSEGLGRQMHLDPKR
jgi:DNA-binding NarL/FixJ family response regulator